MALILLDPTACPDCAAPLLIEVVDQPALLRHGGYGATHCRTVRFCGCGYLIEARSQERRP